MTSNSRNEIFSWKVKIELIEFSLRHYEKFGLVWMPLEFEPLDIWCDGEMDLPEHFMSVSMFSQAGEKLTFFLFYYFYYLLVRGLKKKY